MSNTPWLDPSAEVWTQHYGEGTFPWGKAAKALGPLKAHHAPEEIAARLDNYLSATNAQYVSLFRFRETFAAWGSSVAVDENGILRDGR